MPSWPGTLPGAPLAGGFAETLADPVVRTLMDAGPAKRRRRFTAGVGRMTATFRMTAAQLDDFETFYANDIASGALAYDWTHPRSAAAISVALRGAPETRPVQRGLFWLVTLELDVLP